MAANRIPLSKERIVAAATTFVDEHGRAALSMRKLGAELNVEAMSLYNHIENKDQLLNAVVDSLYDEINNNYQPDMARDWREDMRLLSFGFREVAIQHPNLTSLVVGRESTSESKAMFLEYIHDSLIKAGFDTQSSARAFSVVASWLVGFIRQELTIPGFTEGNEKDIDFASLAPAFLCTAYVGIPAIDHFRYGLEVLIGGFERELETASLAATRN